MDGDILDEPLRTMGFTQNWLYAELDKLGAKVEDVYFAQVDTYGELTVDLLDDQIQVPQNEERKLLYANLKKCQADLELFSLSTKSKKAKKMYESTSQQLDQVITDIAALLKT